MKTIDRYIISKYITLFIFILLSLVLVFTLFNWIDQNDKYTSRGAEAWTILKFYIYNVPYFVNIVIPICSLLAALLTYSNLSNYNELVALQAAGISRFRAIIPSLITSIAIAVLYFAFSEFIGIDATVKKNKILAYEINKESVKPAFEKRNSVFRDRDNSIVQYVYLNASKNFIKNFNIIYFDDSLNVLKRIDSDSMHFSNNKWTAYKTYLRTKAVDDSIFQVEYDSAYSDIQLSVEPMALIDRKFNPGRIERFQKLDELLEYSSNRESFGLTTSVVDYEIYNAIFFPLSIFFMTFIGSFLGSVKAKGGMMVYFFLSIFICLVYICVLVMGKVLGQANTLSPFPEYISSAFLGAILPHVLTSVTLLFFARRS